MAYQILEMADGQRMALYAQGNSVLYCFMPFARGMIPTEVRRDYLAHFEEGVFRDTVCYVYEDLDHNVILDTLGAGPARIILTAGPLGYGFCNLRLVVRDGELYLFLLQFPALPVLLPGRLKAVQPASVLFFSQYLSFLENKLLLPFKYPQFTAGPIRAGQYGAWIRRDYPVIHRYKSRFP